MRLVYFGTGSFAIPALRALENHVCLVVTQPDRPTGRGMKVQPSPMKMAAAEMGLPVRTPERAKSDEFVAEIQALEPDALVVASYGQILSQRLLDVAKRGGINLHGSILPHWRGAAPIQRAIEHGDEETGVTLMQMDKGMDTGDIIAIERLRIGSDETYGELQDRLARLAARMALDWMPKIVAGDYPRVAQDPAVMSLAPKIQKSECRLDFREEASSAYARHKAFTPAPGSFIETRAGKLKLLSVRLGTESDGPGVVVSIGIGLEVGFSKGSLILLEVQPEGKKRMSGRDFANGARLKPGSSLA